MSNSPEKKKLRPYGFKNKLNSHKALKTSCKSGELQKHDYPPSMPRPSPRENDVDIESVMEITVMEKK